MATVLFNHSGLTGTRLPPVGTTLLTVAVLPMRAVYRSNPGYIAYMITDDDCRWMQQAIALAGHIT